VRTSNDPGNSGEGGGIVRVNLTALGLRGGDSGVLLTDLVGVTGSSVAADGAAEFLGIEGRGGEGGSSNNCLSTSSTLPVEEAGIGKKVL